MKTSNTTNYIHINMPKERDPLPLLSLFQSKQNDDLLTIDEYVNPQEWFSLVPPVGKASICVQGFNQKRVNSVRLGAIGTTEDQCTQTWDEIWIGIGGHTLYCNTKYNYLPTAGQCCLVDCKRRSDQAMAYLFIK